MESESISPSPVLRVTTDISEVKENNECIRHSYSKPSSRESRNNFQGNAFMRKKTLHPLHCCNPYQGKLNMGGTYINVQDAKSNVSTFTQRIMSAKLLRVKQLQNQLAESQARITELVNENKLLKTLQRRQDNALKKYEGSQEQLPQLIKSHNEEIRVINSKFKQLKLNYRILENKLKERDTELMNLREQHKHLIKLSRDKQLGDREKLAKKVAEMESVVKSQQEKIQLLTRKIELEGKNYRHRLNLEISKHKETQEELREARKTINNLKSSLEGARYVNKTVSKKMFQRSVHENQAASRTSLPAPPPTVSIRQPQRLVHSETALNGDEDSDSDSFSFGLQNIPQNVEEDSCSDRSDSNIGENTTIRLFNKSKNTNNRSINLSEKLSRVNNDNNLTSSNDGLQKVNQISDVRPVNHVKTVIKSVENKLSLNKADTNDLKNINEPKQRIPNKVTQNSIRILHRRNSTPTVLPMLQNLTQESQNNITRNSSFKPSISLESVKTDSSDKRSKNNTSTSPDDIIVADSYDVELKNIQKEIEKELENTTYNKIEDEKAIILPNETLSHSMEAAIEELERKFKIFDMPKIRKETEDDLNKIVDRACRNLMEEDKDINSDNHINNNKTIDDTDNFLFNLENSTKKLENHQPDLVLAESKKADLLKALNNIDSNNEISGYFHDKKDENFKSNFLNKTSGQVSNSIGNNLGKRDLIKEIFREDSGAVSTK
ncbi:hypothetical protein O3M35_003282 [Rhynocoris fuscipes]|uniref:Lebercilin domain-containing protein n=1 Tax=Rhynocoris fuscipes TaxID=488301 RepID=A0AAW1CPH0_9HEMI